MYICLFDFRDIHMYYMNVHKQGLPPSRLHMSHTYVQTHKSKGLDIIFIDRSAILLL